MMNRKVVDLTPTELDKLSRDAWADVARQALERGLPVSGSRDGRRFRLHPDGHVEDLGPVAEMLESPERPEVYPEIAEMGSSRTKDTFQIISEAKPSSQGRTHISKKILVVDDDPMVCMAIEIYLERHGFQVTIAAGGEAGLRALEGTAFDLMIVDIFMPHMRGFESIGIFHGRAPAVPLIAMSGYAFSNPNSPAPDFVKMALDFGASRCLSKPFTPTSLLTTIEDCLAEADYQQQLLTKS
jgi:CheY-like chemotaxis protein